MPLKQFCCSICGVCAPKEYLKHGQMAKRMAWLRRHRKRAHPKAHAASVKKAVRTRQLKGRRKI